MVGMREIIRPLTGDIIGALIFSRGLLLLLPLEQKMEERKEVSFMTA